MYNAGDYGMNLRPDAGNLCHFFRCEHKAIRRETHDECDKTSLLRFPLLLMEGWNIPGVIDEVKRFFLSVHFLKVCLLLDG